MSDKERLNQFLSSGESIKFTVASDGVTRDDLSTLLDGELRYDVRDFGNAKDRPSGSDLLAPSKPSSMDLSLLCCLSFRHTPNTSQLPWIQTQPTTYSVTANHCLLKHIKRALITQSWVNPSQCPSFDIDLKSGILNIIATLGLSFKYPHVRGTSQDDETYVHLLVPWTAQMNVHANALLPRQLFRTL